jgi:hypothetical protein
MGVSFWDVFKTAAPIGAAFIPGVGPLASIAIGGALSGGIEAAEGGGIGDILKAGALGAGSSAAGIGVGSALSKGATEAGTKAAETAAQKAMLATDMATEGGLKFGAAGVPMFSPEALSAGAEKLAEGTAKSRLLGKVGDITSPLRGKNPEAQDALLNKVGKGTKLATTALGAINPEQQQQQPPRFMEAQMRMHPGFNPAYQFGRRRSYGTPVVGGGYY